MKRVGNMTIGDNDIIFVSLENCFIFHGTNLKPCIIQDDLPKTHDPSCPGHTPLTKMPPKAFKEAAQKVREDAPRKRSFLAKTFSLLSFRSDETIPGAGVGGTRDPIDGEGSGPRLDLVPKKSSSENLAKLPTLTDDEFNFFQIILNGDLHGLREFMRSSAFRNVDINKTDRFGFSALHHAVRRQDEEMVSLFLSQEGILTYDTLFHAIQEENIEITKTVLAHQDHNQSIQVAETLGATVSRVASATLAIVGLPTVLSPTNISSKKSLQDLEEFDSEFPTYFTPLLVSARKGNSTLMELFYERGERLESVENHHNCGCTCKICYSASDKTLTSAYERLHLFDALTNPNYICFITAKSKEMDPAHYAIDKIKKCRELEEKEVMFQGKYTEFEERLANFLKDLVELCRTNEETQTFFSCPDTETQGRLKGKFPRIWTLVGLNLVDVVAHPHSQYIVYKQWATTFWPEWTTYGIARQLFETVLRIVFLPVFAIILWFGFKGRIGRRLSSPVSRHLNWLASYIIFLTVLAAQVMLPQRCNNIRGRLPYSVMDYACPQRGAPNIGSEWFLVLYELGLLVSLVKRNSIPWLWKSLWTWYELLTHLLFAATFFCWFRARMGDIPPTEERKQWGQYYPEIFAEIFLSLSCIMAFGRTLRFLQLHRVVGPIQIGLGRMVENFVATILVMFILIFSFTIGLNAIYIPFHGISGFDTLKVSRVQRSPFGEMRKTPEELFWSLYGLSGSDKPDILSFGYNSSDSKLTLFHPTLNQRAGRLLFQFYHILGVLMMFNMLVAYFTSGADEVLNNADSEWKFARTQVYMTFIKDTILPPPFNLFPTLRGVLRFFHYIGLFCFKEGKTETASCSLGQCCFIKQPIDPEDQSRQRRAYRRLILELLHRYRGLTGERRSQKRASSDDVKEIGEELAELKAQIQSKMVRGVRRGGSSPKSSTSMQRISTPPTKRKYFTPPINSPIRRKGSSSSFDGSPRPARRAPLPQAAPPPPPPPPPQWKQPPRPPPLPQQHPQAPRPPPLPQQRYQAPRPPPQQQAPRPPPQQYAPRPPPPPPPPPMPQQQPFKQKPIKVSKAQQTTGHHHGPPPPPPPLPPPIIKDLTHIDTLHHSKHRK